MPQLTDGSGRPFPLAEELGRGGQGAVYRVAGRPDLVAKVYLKPPSRADIQKLEAQVQACRPEVLGISAWPSALLRDAGGGVQGLVMPLVDPDEYREIHNLFGPASRRKHFPQAEWDFLVHVARNVARAFAVIHDGGHLIGDVSSRNMLVSQKGHLRLIDTDSFQVRFGQQVFACPVGTAESTPPELQGQSFGTFLRSPNHDLFGLAVIVFQLLFQGRHPYLGIHADGTARDPAQAIKGSHFAYSLRQGPGVRPPPQTLSLKDLPLDIADLFERAFAPGSAPRPTAKEWSQALDSLVKVLVKCTQDPTHKYARQPRCPWCALNQGLTAKVGFTSGAKRLDVRHELNQLFKQVEAVPIPAAPPQVTLPQNVAPLSLVWPRVPVLAVVPFPDDKVRAAKTQRLIAGVLVVALVVMLLLGAGALLDLIVTAGITWCWSRGNLKRQRAQHLKQQQDSHQAIIRQFESERNKLREGLQTEVRQLDAQLSSLKARQQRESVLEKYRAARKHLAEQRDQLWNADQDEQRQLRQVVEEHRQVALEQHLKRQILAVGDVKGIGAATIVALQAKGYRSAHDVNPTVRWVKGIGERRANDLMAWRYEREGRLMFDPSTVPAAALIAVQQAAEQKNVADLKRFASAIQTFTLNIRTWRSAEEAITTELRRTLVDLEQRRLALRRLEENRA